MDHKQELEKLNKESLKQIEEYLKSKGELKEDEHLKVVRQKRNGKQPGINSWKH